MKKLIPALALLLVSAVMLATSSFAWFSMNTTVTVTGMSVSTRISDNLQIADDDLSSTAKLGDSYFQNGLNQTVEGILEPVSTVDGLNFFYTDTANVKADGDAITDTYIEYDADEDASDTANYENAFSENYDVRKTDTALAYVDYVFQIKAINSSASAPKYVNLTGVNLLYNNRAEQDNNIKAFRVAVFAQDITSTNPSGSMTNLTLKTILAPGSALYRTAGKAVASNAGPVDGEGAMTTSVSNLNTAANIGTVAAGQTGYFKVVVRLWLEGEDTTCNSQTYLSLTKNWTLDLKMDLANATGGVTAIGSTASAVITNSNLVGTVTLDGTGKLSNLETPASYQWKNAADNSNAAGTGADTYQFTATAAGSYYCVITSTRGSVYITNTLEFTAP